MTENLPLRHAGWGFIVHLVWLVHSHHVAHASSLDIIGTWRNFVHRSPGTERGLQTGASLGGKCGKESINEPKLLFEVHTIL